MPARYTDPQLPEHFALETRTSAGWDLCGLYSRTTFMPVDAEPGALIHQTIGSPVFIRCVGRTDDVLHCLSGSGRPFDYRVVPLPHPSYQGADLEQLDNPFA